jgi:hypothetical protein
MVHVRRFLFELIIPTSTARVNDIETPSQRVY